MKSKIWLESALNGPWSRSRQPKMPITINEIIKEGIEVANAGAAIVHIHAYDESTGKQKDDWEIYAKIIEGIRNKVDVIVYPTIPLAGGEDASQPLTPSQRFEAVENLAKRGMLEWAVVDPGSVNFSHQKEREAGKIGFVYLNPEPHIRYGLELAAQYGFHPSYACYEPGFVRLGNALQKVIKNVPKPIYRVMFSDDFTFSFPPESYGLNAYYQLLSKEVPHNPWMIAGLAVDLRSLIPEAIALDMHIRVGLEDAPWHSPLTNVQWIQETVNIIQQNNFEVATAEEIRKQLNR